MKAPHISGAFFVVFILLSDTKFLLKLHFSLDEKIKNYTQ